MKRIVAKNIVNNYGLKTLKDFLRLKGWGCLYDNWKHSFLPRLIFNWRTFPRRVTELWSRGWEKNQVSTNQNSRNSWSLIARRTIWGWALLISWMLLLNNFCRLNSFHVLNVFHLLTVFQMLDTFYRLHAVL